MKPFRVEIPEADQEDLRRRLAHTRCPDELAEMLRLAARGTPPPISVPVGVAVFPHDPFLPIRRFAERDVATIQHWSEFDRGGHFAALEQPQLFSGDVRELFRSLR